MHIKAHILACLQEIRYRGPLDVEAGICNNVFDLRDPRGFSFSLTEMHEVFKETWVRWPKYSGNPTYPVPAPDDHQLQPDSHCTLGDWAAMSSVARAYIIFYDVLNGWEGEYGNLRMELLDFLISELEGRQ